MTDKFGSAEAVFATAAKRFYEELSNEDKLNFQEIENAEDMVASIERNIVQLNSQRTSRLLDACKKVDNFRKSMDPFFRIVDIFVSTHPEWAGIAWGAVRLVFQLCSHFTGFFEKLAGMFEEFGRNLPNYVTQIEIINSRIRNSSWRQTHECLFKALSFVYVDIMQFCHDACRLFSRKRGGLLGKVAIIWDLSWTPFDDRFSEILGRLKRHQQDFDSGLKNVYSEELIMHFNAMDLERVRNSQQRDVFSEQREAEKRRSIDEKIEKLQKWIASPNWTGPYEAAKEKRLADTGLWILQRPEYSSWLEQEVPYPARGSVFAKNVLVVTAKPGFGKTILSTRIIEDLRRRSRLCGQSLGQSLAIPLAYFYFDQQQADRYSRYTALQAVAAQLLFSQRNNLTFIDLACLMMIDESQGQICASAQSLEILIRIYLEQLNGSFLVFDGLEECPEWEEFLVTLRKCAEETSCKIVLITRPHLLLDAIIGPKAFRMDLESDENMNEIYAILRPELADLLRRGKLGPKYGPHDMEHLVESLAKRADSIILWAALMMKYLQSPYLSPTERVEIIEEVKSFQGLDDLFGAILLDIGKRVPKSQHEKIRRVFGWLAVAQRPWTSKMMEIALAVQAHRPSTQADFMDSFDESLMQLCGPLVEIRQGYIVRFIHTSVVEYLTLLQESSFSVSLSSAHCSTANLCLLYLLNEVPHEPLSGNSSVVPHQPSVLSKFCLISYAASLWPFHARQSWEEAFGEDSMSDFVSSQGCKDLCQLLNKIITDKRLITVWIEASWVFGSAPSMLDLPDRIQGATGEISMQLQIQELESLAETLQRLSRNLRHLKLKWSHILSVEPNEIWLPSTNAFTDCEFWVGTNEAKVNWLSSDTDAGAILIASQVSSNGTEVGVVRIWPPDPSKAKIWAQHQDLHGDSVKLDIPHPSSWVVVYQIWSLESMECTWKSRFYLPEKKVLSPGNPRLSAYGYGGSLSEEFRFPVAFSPSLRLAFIMGVIIQVGKTSQTGATSVQKHLLFDPRCPFGHQDDTMLARLNRPQYFNGARLRAFELMRGPRDLSNHPFHTWYRCYFSPLERYAIIIKGGCAPDEIRFEAAWVIDVHERIDDHSPVFQLIATTGIRLNGAASHSVVCHPHRAVLAISMPALTVLWRFGHKDDGFITVSNYPLTQMRFSNCGNFLYGLVAKHDGEGEPKFLNLTDHLDPIPLAITDGSSSSTCLAPAQTSSTDQSVSIWKEMNDDVEQSLVQVSAMPQFTAFQGQLQMSALKQDLESGSILLQTLCSDGEMREETITRLPSSLTLENSYSTLVPAGSHQNLRIVLDKATQETYSRNNVPDIPLPLVLDREKRSIPTLTYKPSKQIESSDSSSTGKRVLNAAPDDMNEDIRVLKKRRE